MARSWASVWCIETPHDRTTRVARFRKAKEPDIETHRPHLAQEGSFQPPFGTLNWMLRSISTGLPTCQVEYVNSNGRQSFAHSPREMVPRNPNLLASVKTALNGIGFMLSSEPNFRIHIFASGMVALAGIWFRISRQEAVLLVLASVAVLAAEMINTTLERIVNIASPEWHEEARNAKDVAAGMVLMTAAGATLCGILVFGPYVV